MAERKVASLVIGKRKLVKIGNSKAITLPKEWLRENRISLATQLVEIRGTDFILHLAPKYQPTQRQAIEFTLAFHDALDEILTSKTMEVGIDQ